jgi:hypothetical protein
MVSASTNDAIATLVTSGQIGAVVGTERILVLDCIVEFGEEVNFAPPPSEYLIDGAKYIVTVNGVERESIGTISDGMFSVGGEHEAVRHIHIYLDSVYQRGNRIEITTSLDECPVTIELVKEIISPINPKYLPDTLATKADILGAMEASY